MKQTQVCEAQSGGTQMQTWHFYLCMDGLPDQSCWLCWWPQMRASFLSELFVFLPNLNLRLNQQKTTVENLLIAQRRKNVLIYKSNHNGRLTMPMYDKWETCSPWWQVLLMLSKAVEVLLIDWNKRQWRTFKNRCCCLFCIKTSSFYHSTPTSHFSW